MTATDNLRRMLDEHGVEWGNVRNDGSESDYFTEWEFEGIHGYAVATEWSVGGGLSVETHQNGLTPEQAIAATLGRIEDKSRWAELFGTPERAARTLAGISCDGDCYSCSLPGAYCYCSGTALLEWLRGDA